jgi:WD40 repeat protein
VEKAEPPLKVWKHDDSVRGALFSRDDSRVLAWSDDGAVKLWDVEKAEPPLQVWEHGGPVANALFSRDESRVLAWSANGAVKLWSIEKDDLLSVWNFADVDECKRNDDDVTLFSRDKSRALKWGGGPLTLREVEKDDQLLEDYDFVCGAVFSHDESRVVAWVFSEDGGGAVKLWDVEKAESPLKVWKHDDSIGGALFSRDDSRVLAWSDDGAVKLWDVEKAEPPLKVWKQDKGVRGGAVFSRDESRFLTWSADGAVKLWDVKKAQPLQVWRHEVARVRGAVFSLWDEGQDEDDQVAVVGAAFSRDESRVLAWSADGAVKLWDVTEAEPLHSRVLVWSDECSGSPDEVKLWDPERADVELTPAERIKELEVRSATRLGAAGRLIPLKYDRWIELVRSPEYASIQRSKQAKAQTCIVSAVPIPAPVSAPQIAPPRGG